MKPYGIPRNKNVESPDVVDIQNYAMKSSAGRFKERGGDFKSYTRNSKSKRSVRRHFKKCARRNSKKLCKQEG